MNACADIAATQIRRAALRTALRDVIEQAAWLIAREDLITAPDNLPQIQKSLDEAKFACELLYPPEVEDDGVDRFRAMQDEEEALHG